MLLHLIGRPLRTIGLPVAVVAALAGLVLASPAAATGSVTQPLSGGLRTASISDVTLGALTYSHDQQANTGTLTLNVDDSSGTGEGWNVTIQSSDFAYSGSYNGDPISASHFAIISANAPQWSAGQAIDGTNGPKVPGSNATGSLDVARKVLHANAGYGQGSYSQTLDVELTIPGMARAGDYLGSLTVTVNAGP